MHAVRAFPLTGSSVVVSANPAIYAGFTARETAGAVATLRVWDNPSAASGTLLETIRLAANESAREYYVGGVFAAAGVYVEVVAGTVEGSVRVG